MLSLYYYCTGITLLLYWNIIVFPLLHWHCSVRHCTVIVPSLVYYCTALVLVLLLYDIIYTSLCIFYFCNVVLWHENCTVRYYQCAIHVMLPDRGRTLV